MGKKLKTKTQKQRCIRLNLDGTFDEIMLPRDKGIIRDGEDRINMQPACVFSERKKRGFFRTRRRIVLFVQGTANALKFKNVEITKSDGSKEPTQTIEDLNPFWTMGEAAQFVEKKIAESLDEHKPMTWIQFIILLVPLAITCIGVFKLLLHFGAL